MTFTPPSSLAVTDFQLRASAVSVSDVTTQQTLTEMLANDTDAATLLGLYVGSALDVDPDDSMIGSSA